MLRNTILAAARSARTASSPVVAARSMSMAALRRPAMAAPQLQQQQLRFASSGALSKEDISSRILEVLKSFEKVDPAKASAGASFTQDLGLDSLDAVEVVMAIEEEFSIEIPDEDADAITTVGQAIDYISRTPEAH